MHTYREYGLFLRTNRTIPGLVSVPETRPGDVHVEMAGAQPRQKSSAPQAILYASPGRDERGEHFFEAHRLDGDRGTRYRLRFAYEDAYAEFLIDQAGSQVRAIWSDVVPYEDVVTLLLGPVLGCILRVRGVTCLHASVVAASDDGAIAIIGPKGGGKSTVAAVLAQRGCAVLADDVAALAQEKDAFLVQPGCLRMRLWPSTVDVLPGLTAAALPRVLSEMEKRYVDLTVEQNATQWRFQPEPLPLVAIYVLDDPNPSETVPHVTPISPANSLIALMNNTYVDYMLDQTGRAHDFAVLGRLVSTVPVRQIHRPFDLNALPQTCQAILDDVRATVETKMQQVTRGG